MENDTGRNELIFWLEQLRQNSYLTDGDFRHSISFRLPEKFASLDPELESFAETVLHHVVPLVQENNLPSNLPRIDRFDSIGLKVDKIIHHPSYEAAGNYIYGSRLMERMSKKGGLLEGLSFLFLSAHAGEAGHNCPIACSAGLIRVLQKVGDFPKKQLYLKKLLAPSFKENYTGAQFVTEIQGGSDVGRNETTAYKDENGDWRITGEKWFCSNANADLILMTARYDNSIPGTKGLGLFLVPAKADTGESNGYTLRRLKDKIGTRSMATAEIDFHGAFAIPIGPLEDGFKMLMENVLHISRLFNTICVLGMARRAYQIAYAYARHRNAFGNPILTYPLVKANLARIKAENTALTASICATLSLQDAFDRTYGEDSDRKLLLRLLANINKYLSARWSVEHIHHCLDVLAGNGTIETFSNIPLLLRDCIICENWEGTHNVLLMQILRDIQKYRIDEIFVEYMKTAISSLPHRDQLQQALNTLTACLKNLKTADPELQMLQIQNVVDQMGILFAAAQLLAEAVDQKQRGVDSKMNSFEYFVYSHLLKKKEYDADHLSLIKTFFLT